MNLLEEFSSATTAADIRSAEGRALLTATVAQLQRTLPTGQWPRPYQTLGICYGHLAKDRYILGDAPGVGKTHQAVARFALRPRPGVIVTTSSMVPDWAKAMKAWAPKLPITVLDTVAATFPRTPTIFLTTWTLLETHAARIKLYRPQLLVADEAHYASNPETHRYKALKHLTDVTPGVMLLTGTPVNNSAVELWTLLNLLDPQAWPDPAPFEAMDPEDLDASYNTRLIRRIRQFMIRRTKDRVLTELPDKVEHNLFVDGDAVAMTEYRRAEREFESWLTDQMQRRVAAEMKKAGKVEDPAELMEEVHQRVERSLKTEYFAKMAHLRNLTGKMKAPIAVKWIGNVVSSGENVLALAEHKAVIEAIEEGLRARRIPYVKIVGSTSKKERKAAVDAFQKKAVKVLIGSKAAREGLTLTAAARCLRVERAFTPTGEEQGEDRLHRVGQTRQVVVTTLHAKGTVDVRLAEINRAKRAIVERVIGGAGTKAA